MLRIYKVLNYHSSLHIEPEISQLFCPEMCVFLKPESGWTMRVRHSDDAIWLMSPHGCSK